MIRKVYTDLIIRKLREEGVSWLFSRARQYFLLHLSERFHRPLCGPALGSLLVTYRCNFDCYMCDMPHKALHHSRSNKTEFDTYRFKSVINDFRKLGIPGIGFTGGEPLLREDIFELLAETKRLGMIANISTNGRLLGDIQAQKIIKCDVDTVNISLDGATAKTHDLIRQTPGAFDKAVEAVLILAHHKKRNGSRLRIKTVTVMDEANIDEVPQILSLGRTLGADCTELIPRQPFSELMQSRSAEPQLLAKVDRLIEFLIDQKCGNFTLENSVAHLRLFHSSFAGLPSPVHCNAGYNSLAIDCYGTVFPCVPWLNWDMACGSIVKSSLNEVWNSAEYQQQREKTSKCRNCYLNCQTELNLLFDVRGSLMRKFKFK